MTVCTLKRDAEYESVKISFLTDKANRDALDSIATALDRDRSYILTKRLPLTLRCSNDISRRPVKQSKKPTRAILPAIGKSSRHSPNTSAMRVKWLRSALKNLHQALNYIAHDNPITASNAAESIWETVARLEQPPHMDRSGRLKARELIVPRLPYVIRYRIKTETVEILRIHHMAQHWPEGN